MIKFQIDKHVIPLICIFGILGNLLNVVVMSRGTPAISDAESAVTVGHLALNLSDAVYCIVHLPQLFLEERHAKQFIRHPRRDFWCYRDLYLSGTVHTVVTFSTYITVVMSVFRYVSICVCPLRLRDVMTLSKMRVAIVCSFVGAILVNLPFFFSFRIFSKSDTSHFVIFTEFRKSRTYVIIEHVQTMLRLVIPVTTLLFCNVKFAITLRDSSRFRTRHSRGAHSVRHRLITMTLFGVICIHLIGVMPHTVLYYVTKILLPDKPSDFSEIMTRINNIKITIIVLNVLEAVSLSMNFLLYCTVNAIFRKNIKSLVSRFMRLMTTSRGTLNVPTIGSNQRTSLRVTNM